MVVGGALAHMEGGPQCTPNKGGARASAQRKIGAART